VEEMSAVFQPRNWLLTAAVPAATFRINEGYDVPRLAKSLDFINVMTYDLHGTWDNYADHHAPLRKRPFDSGATQNLHSDGALSYWISKGAPARKIIFGIPFYGRNFRLANPNNSKPKAPIAGAGTVGPFTKEAGFVAYFEICRWLQEGGWQELEDEAGSPYLVKGDQWIGYDTVESVLTKMDYIRSTGLGGAMIWAVGLDDIKGDCGPERPLLRAINDGLRRNGGTSSATAAPPKPTTARPTTAATPRPTTAAPLPQPPTTVAPFVPAPTAAPTRPPPIVLPTTPTPTTSFDPSCLIKGDSFWPHPDDCGQFYRCVGATPYFFNCPSGLHFNPSILVCDWPENAQCTAKNSLNNRLTGKSRHFSNSKFILRRSIFSQSFAFKTADRQVQTNKDYKVVCYYSSWAWLRRGDAEFVPENVLSSSCTHVLYAYGGLDPKTLLLKSNDIWTDISNSKLK
jgi:chitinase